MEYNLSLAEFQSGKMFDSNRKFIHKTGNRFKLFPFVTQPNSVPVEDLSQLVGTFLCKIEGKKPDKIAVSELVAELKQETDIEAGQEQLFYETVKQLFFTSNEQLRPLNLQMLSHIPYKEVSEEKVAEYLVDVLGNKDNLKRMVTNAKTRELASSNVFERLVLKHLKSSDEKNTDDIPYYGVVTSLTEVFESDFKYILGNQNRESIWLHC